MRTVMHGNCELNVSLLGPRACAWVLHCSFPLQKLVSHKTLRDIPVHHVFCMYFEFDARSNER
jgi:hypothetical protein